MAPASVSGTRLGGWWIYWGITLVLLVMTFWQRAELPGAVSLERWVLSRENTIGAWWSGAALIVSCVLAASVAAPLWKRDRATALGFAGVSLLAFGLTIDELGSLHERASLFLPGTPHSALILPGLTGAAVLAASLALLWRRRDGFPGAWGWVLAAFAIFGSVYLQEVIEHSFKWSRLGGSVRVFVEEGTELVGMAVLIRGMLGAARSLGRTPDQRRQDLTLGLLAVGGVAVAVAGPLILMMLTMTGEGFHPRWGHFWTTPVVMLLALGAWMAGLRGCSSGRGGPWLLPAGLLLALSINAVAHLEVFLGYLPRPEVAFVAGLGLTLVVLVLLIVDRPTGWRLPARLAVILVALVGLVPTISIALMAVSIAAALLLASMAAGPSRSAA